MSSTSTYYRAIITDKNQEGGVSSATSNVSEIIVNSLPDQVDTKYRCVVTSTNHDNAFSTAYSAPCTITSLESMFYPKLLGDNLLLSTSNIEIFYNAIPLSFEIEPGELTLSSATLDTALIVFKELQGRTLSLNPGSIDLTYNVPFLVTGNALSLFGDALDISFAYNPDFGTSALLTSSEPLDIWYKEGVNANLQTGNLALLPTYLDSEPTYSSEIIGNALSLDSNALSHHEVFDLYLGNAALGLTGDALVIDNQYSAIISGCDLTLSSVALTVLYDIYSDIDTNYLDLIGGKVDGYIGDRYQITGNELVLSSSTLETHVSFDCVIPNKTLFLTPGRFTNVASLSLALLGASLILSANRIETALFNGYMLLGNRLQLSSDTLELFSGALSNIYGNTLTLTPGRLSDENGNYYSFGGENLLLTAASLEDDFEFELNVQGEYDIPLIGSSHLKIRVPLSDSGYQKQFNLYTDTSHKVLYDLDDAIVKLRMWIPATFESAAVDYYEAILEKADSIGTVYWTVSPKATSEVGCYRAEIQIESKNAKISSVPFVIEVYYSPN